MVSSLHTTPTLHQRYSMWQHVFTDPQQAVAMTSNGLTLAKKLPALQDAGLTHLNLSLDTLQPARFEAMTRRRGHARVMQALQEALRLGYDPVKVRV